MHLDLYQQQRGITLNLRRKAWQLYMVLKVPQFFVWLEVYIMHCPQTFAEFTE